MVFSSSYWYKERHQGEGQKDIWICNCYHIDVSAKNRFQIFSILMSFGHFSLHLSMELVRSIVRHFLTYCVWTFKLGHSSSFVPKKSYFHWANKWQWYNPTWFTTAPHPTSLNHLLDFCKQTSLQLRWNVPYQMIGTGFSFTNWKRWCNTNLLRLVFLWCGVTFCFLSPPWVLPLFRLNCPCWLSSGGRRVSLHIISHRLH